jgi:uncharacterized protein YndB with AHSA1/START domain
MATAKSPTLTIILPSDREIVMTRVFDAPRELVFQAHSSCEHLANWFGPRRYTLSVCDMDFRPGGKYRFVHSGDGQEHGFRGEFREIVEPERIVWTFEYEGMPGHISVDTLTLEDLGGGRTMLTARSLFDSVEDRDGMLQSGMEEGATESWDRLAEHLDVMKGAAPAALGGGLVIERIFDAPRDLVWKAWTDPEHVKLWWGPKGFTAPVVQADFRVGGAYLYCMRSSEGQDYWSTGVYRDIVPQERFVATDSFADEHGNVVPASHYGMPADFPLEMLVTVTFEDLGDKTRMILRHEGMPADEMGEMASQGWNESLDKLAEVLANIQ